MDYTLRMKSSQKTLIISGGVLLIATLILNIFIVQRVVYLDRFFNSVSAEYRAIRGGAGAPTEPAVAQADSGGANSGGSDRACISVDLDLGSDPVLGDPSAPVVMVEYSDFECPFCSRYFSETYSQIKSTYIDTGMVRLYYKDFPLDNIHPLARYASIAANCVYDDQGDAAFFEAHDKIFELQARLSRESITQIALESGISAATLASCENDSSYSSEIDDDIAEGQSIGINGTPSFVINGELVIGARPYNDFERAIEDALAGNGC